MPSTHSRPCNLQFSSGNLVNMVTIISGADPELVGRDWEQLRI